jgi:hypothetical protein
MVKWKEKEADVQRAILLLLEYSHMFHYRNNSGGMVAESGHFVRFGATGSPDIIIVQNGKYIGVEVKGTDGKQSDNQKIFQQELEKAGGEYLLVHSVEEFLDQFKVAPKKLIKK